MLRLALICLLVLAWTTPALAEEVDNHSIETTTTDPSIDDEVGLTTTDLHLRPHQGWTIAGQLILAPAYFMAYITVHEGSHALAALILGCEIVGFEPYPHTVEYRNAEGEIVSDFIMGYTWYNRPASEPWMAAHISIAPYLTDILIFVNCDLLLQYVVDPHSDGAPFLLAGGMITPLVNFVAGLNCMGDNCDLTNFSTVTGVPRGVIMIVGYALAFTALWRCLHQFRRIFLEPRAVRDRRREQENRGRAISISPLGGDELIGVGVSGVF
ncbi:hypothetical protein KKF05_04300 [Patescibacteria group bacterium]|nr:hypothetical protein [Patescibacteria group bacterium]MBU1028858.1 hypothetical protein [Patescibacteria group bacterium]MBU1915523.1 hypothetical protein [Patescibacteria group bacterium]